MKVIVKSRHVDLTPSLKAHAEHKLSDAVARIFDKPAAKIEIELSKSGNTKTGEDQECKVTVFMPKNKTINISEVSDDMYKAIDLAQDRLLHQIKRQQEKKIDSQRDRKGAQRDRNETAHSQLGAEDEPWEKEVEEFEAEKSNANA
ncbi:ribosome-associated translation inhibitor RaiA [Myxococcota bacterium]|nr:ribosome-associated translation inhibitor RaiA [Myxococcota bacterium]